MFSFEFINALRRAELLAALDLFPQGARVLEIGAGAGEQARALQSAGFEVEAIDIQTSDYAGREVFPVKTYDGKIIPFADASFDAVFSSNVLEHIKDLDAMQREIARVLRPGGVCIHILPTHTWRFWTSIATVPALFKHAAVAIKKPNRHNTYMVFRQCGWILLQPRHGEHGNTLTELWSFHPRQWRRRFEQDGYNVVTDRPAGFFYTGEMIFNFGIGLPRRAGLSRYLGSSSHVFQIRRVADKPPIPGTA